MGYGGSMSKQAILLTVLFLASIVFCGIRTQPATAQPANTIHILPDGSVDPANAPLQIEGYIYRATANINTTIVVIKNNIVLDGQGYTLQGTGKSNNQAAINLTCTGVTIKNFHIKDWQIGVLGAYDNNKIVGNEFTDNNYDIAVYGKNYEINQNFLYYVRIQGSNVHLTENEFQTRKYGSAFWISNSTGIVIETNEFRFNSQTTSFISTDDSGIKVYHNNFLNAGEIQLDQGEMFLFILTIPHTDLVIPSWDNGFPSGGNYWSDFSSKYGNASMIDDSGIWNITYEISSTAQVVDRYPLYNPYEIQVASLPTPPPSESPAPSIPEFPLWVLVLLLVAILLAVVSSKKGIMGKPMGTVFA